MKSLFNWSLVFSLFFLIQACGGKKVQIDSASTPVPEGKIAMQFEWLKVKGKKYDFRMDFINGTQKSVIFYLTDMHCFKGTNEGTLKHTFFNTGHRTFKLKPGQKDAANMVCNLDAESAGNYRVVIAKVLDNPSGDGKTPGEQLAENIEIVQTESK